MSNAFRVSTNSMYFVVRFFISLVALFSVQVLAQSNPPTERPAAQRTADSIVYHGKLVRPNGVPITGSLSVSVKVTSPEPSQCLLWAEAQVVEAKNGGFSLELGYTENRVAGAAGGVASSFREVFLNNPGLSMTGAQCAQGNSYSPGYTDDRLMTVEFQDGGATVAVERIPIKSVPFAKQAQEVAGYGINNLVKISGSGSVIVFDPAEVQVLKSASALGSANQLLGVDAAGTSVEYKSITAGSGIVVTPSAGGIEISATGGSGSGSVAEVSVSGSPLAVTNGTSTPQISITQAGSVQAGYLSAADWNLFNSKQPAGTYLTAVPANSVGTSEVNDGSLAPADLNFAGSMAVNTGVVVRDGTQFYNKTCAGNEALIWSVANGWSCSAVVLTESDPQVGVNTTNMLSKWDGSALVASAVSESGGNVGLGTTSPGARLEVAGQIKITGGTPGAGKVLQSDADGLASWAILGGSESTSVSNIGTAGVGVYKQMAGSNVELKKINAGSASLSVTDDVANNELDVDLANLGVSTGKIADDAVTYAKLQNISANNRILGRSTAGAGDAEEITVGSGLSLSGGTLTASGSGGTVTSVGVGGLPLSVVNSSSTPTISITQANGGAAGYLSAADWSLFNSKQPAGAYLTNIDAAMVNSALGYTPISSSSSSQVIGALGFTPVNRAGDSMTGALSLPSNGLIVGASQLVVSGGNVGVGTASPGFKVDVVGDVNVSGNFKVNGVNIATGGGTVTNVAGSAPISVSNGSSTPNISISQASGSTSGFLSSVDWTSFNSKQPAGAYLTSIPANSVGTGEVIDGSLAPADLNFAGSMAVNSGVVVRDGTQFYSKTCAANEALIWSVANGWSCTALVLTEADPQVGANSANMLSKWDGTALVASTVLESGGNVGIGTTSPGARLEVAGQIKITGGTPGAGKVLQSDANGLASWATFGGSESTSVSNIGTAGVGVYKQLTGSNIELKKINAGSSAITITDDTGANELDIDLASLGVATGNLADDAVTYAKLQNVSTNNRLLGRATAGAGNAEEITLGTGLSFTGTTLNGNVGTVTSVGVGGLPLSVVNSTSTPTISIAQANTSTAGFISAADWNLFNSKQPAGAYLTSIDGPQVYTALGYTPVNRAGDTMTGTLALPSNGLAVGANQLVVNGGLVGIGTTSPTLALNVVGSTNSSPATAGTTQTGGSARFENFSSNIVLDFGGNGASGTWLQSTNKANLALNYPISLNPNGGNVGIGTTTPGARLEVAGQIKITGGAPGAGKVLQSDANGLASWATLAAGGVTNVSVGGLPLSVTNGSTTPSISIAQANTSTGGFVSSADWNTFNNKLGTALSTGRVWVGVGNVASEQWFGVDDLKTAAGLQQFAASCTASQTLTWSAITDAFSCSNIAIGNSNIANDSVTYSKMQNISTNNRLLGRSTAGAGDAEEITVGSGLTLSAGTLTASFSALTSSDITTALGYAPVNKTGDSSLGSMDYTSGNSIRFGHANQTDANDGKIGAGLFAAGLNIVGTQTAVAGGRVIATFGTLQSNGPINATGSISSAGNVNADGNLLLASKEALRGNDTWLRLNQAGQFTSGIHVPGFINIGAMTVGSSLLTSPGDANIRVAGSAYVDGNVGIGTTSPGTKLDVNGGITSQAGLITSSNLLLQGDGTNAYIRPTNASSSLYFGSNNTNHMIVNSSGNVGIGTLSPVGRLEILETGDGSSTPLTLSRAAGTGSNNLGISFRLDATNAVFNLDVGGNGNSSARIHLGDPAVSDNPVTLLGSLGVGTISPTTKLEVSGGDISVTGSSSPQLFTRPNTATGVNQWKLYTNTNVSTATDDYFAINAYGNSYSNATAAKMMRINYVEDSATNYYFLAMDGANGYVGVNNPSPAFNLEVDGDRTAAVMRVYNKNTDGDGIDIKVNRSNPTSSNYFLLFREFGDGLVGYVRGDGANGVVYSTTSDVRLKENITPTRYGLKDLLRVQVSDYNFKGSEKEKTGFLAQQLASVYPDPVAIGGVDPIRDPWTVDYGKVTPLIIAGIQDMNRVVDISRVPHGKTSITVNSIGNVGIGLTNPGYKLHVNGAVAGTSAYVNTSDGRLKKDITPIGNSLNRLLELRGVNFNWRREAYPEYNFSNGRDLGVIAQEVEKQFPEAVTKGEDGIKSVAYSKLIAPIIEAIRDLFGLHKGLEVKNAALESRVKNLEQENQELRDRLSAIEEKLK